MFSKIRKKKKLKREGGTNRKHEAEPMRGAWRGSLNPKVCLPDIKANTDSFYMNGSKEEHTIRRLTEREVSRL